MPPPVPAGPVPAGWRLRPAAGLRVVRDGETLLGGSPLRMLRLSARATTLVSGWLAGEPVGEDRDERALARRLLDAGLANPDPPARPPDTIRDVTVVVPVYADPERLRACLAPLAGSASVIVVDDGSPDPDPIAAAAHAAGARYVRHPENRGPSAARNTGIRHATTPLVAFLDADCVPAAGFPGRLLDHLADPAVGLVAPRIASSERGRGPIAAYERTRSALDMGPRPSLVRPYSTVWYVPSAAMLARREALSAGFDEGLALGEDVDLVWRLHDAGWQVRYDPAVVVTHEDRVRPVAWLRRRIAYNESVAPLLTRHPDRVPVLFFSPVAAFAWGAALGGLTTPVVLLTALRAMRLRRALRDRLPGSGPWAVRVALETTANEARDLARALAGPWAPIAPLTERRRLALLLAAMVARDWLADRPALDPFRYGALRLADEATRGVGIWLGCARARDFKALLPRRPPPASRR